MSIYHPYFRPYVTPGPAVGFGQSTEVATATGLAQDPIASIIGCPDKFGMAEMEKGPYRFLCYWLKRDIGKIAILLLIGGVVYFAFLRK